MPFLRRNDLISGFVGNVDAHARTLGALKSVPVTQAEGTDGERYYDAQSPSLNADSSDTEIYYDASRDAESTGSENYDDTPSIPPLKKHEFTFCSTMYVHGNGHFIR